jgi:cell fate regulator YaaT (PSP1 superfamily)
MPRRARPSRTPASSSPSIASVAVPHLIEVAFKGNRKEFFLWEQDDAPPLKAAVIVSADRGEDLGKVHAVGDQAAHRCRGCAHGCGTSMPSRKALRMAGADDSRRADELRAQDEDARRRGMERVRALGLAMKLSDAEWQWDRRKLTFYFTADKRVDFRTLVRDLAAMFRTRIELKQIGVRDEAKRLDGIGRCGRQYCSASWLPELRPVNLGVAKDQRLSLNPSQISGACGRLMCCLRYEHEFYVQSRRHFPKEGKIITTAKGEEKVIANDIFNERVTMRGAGPDAESRVVPLAELKREMAAAAGGRIDMPVEPDEPAGATAEFPSEGVEEILVEEETEGTVTASTGTPRGDAPAPPKNAGAGDARSGSDPSPATAAGQESADSESHRPRRRRGRRGGRRARGGRSDAGTGDTAPGETERGDAPSAESGPDAAASPGDD